MGGGRALLPPLPTGINTRLEFNKVAIYSLVNEQVSLCLCLFKLLGQSSILVDSSQEKRAPESGLGIHRKVRRLT